MTRMYQKEIYNQLINAWEKCTLAIYRIHDNHEKEYVLIKKARLLYNFVSQLRTLKFKVLWNYLQNKLSTLYLTPSGRL